jgi:hypothetical protein
VVFAAIPFVHAAQKMTHVQLPLLLLLLLLHAG